MFVLSFVPKLWYIMWSLHYVMWQIIWRSSWIDANQAFYEGGFFLGFKPKFTAWWKTKSHGLKVIISWIFETLKKVPRSRFNLDMISFNLVLRNLIMSPLWKGGGHVGGHVCLLSLCLCVLSVLSCRRPDTRHWLNAGLMLAHCLQRLPNITPVLGYHVVFGATLNVGQCHSQPATIYPALVQSIVLE